MLRKYQVWRSALGYSICKTYCGGSQIKNYYKLLKNLSAIIVAWVLPKCNCQVLSFVTWPCIFLVYSVLETVSRKKQRKSADGRENESNGKKSQTIKLKVKSSKKRQDPKHEQLSSKPAFPFPLVEQALFLSETAGLVFAVIGLCDRSLIRHTFAGWGK